MYNRYIRGENGTYARVRVPSPPTRQASQTENAADREKNTAQQTAPNGTENGFRFADAAFLRRILDRLNLKDIDTGDLILLMLLFLLFEEKADEELLIALGLLLIL